MCHLQFSNIYIYIYDILPINRTNLPDMDFSGTYYFL